VSRKKRKIDGEEWRKKLRGGWGRDDSEEMNRRGLNSQVRIWEPSLRRM
jgi:hypothetical protein